MSNYIPPPHPHRRPSPPHALALRSRDGHAATSREHARTRAGPRPPPALTSPALIARPASATAPPGFNPLLTTAAPHARSLPTPGPVASPQALLPRAPGLAGTVPGAAATSGFAPPAVGPAGGLSSPAVTASGNSTPAPSSHSRAPAHANAAFPASYGYPSNLATSSHALTAGVQHGACDALAR
jgi:hypothetical protein